MNKIHLRALTVPLLLFTLVLGSCEPTTECCVAPERVLQIRSGTSFGMCTGYCFRELIISETSQMYMLRAIGRGEGTLPDRTCHGTLSNADWSRLSNEVNWATFSRLPATTGCPDCSDGGTEWVEVTFGNSVHKVTFEVQNPPQELATLVEILRGMREFAHSRCE